jgi:predicted nucleic-acid-binding protein
MHGRKRLRNIVVKKLVDANVVLRYLLRDDEELFKISFDLLENVKTGKETIEIAESVLAECVYVLLKVYRVDRIIIAEKLGELFSYKGIGNLDRDDLIEAVKMLGQTQLSIVDCILCAKAVNRGRVLFTFDKELKSEYKKKSRKPVSESFFP